MFYRDLQCQMTDLNRCPVPVTNVQSKERVKRCYCPEFCSEMYELVETFQNVLLG